MLVPCTNCLFTNSKSWVIFYVDDTTLAYHKEEEMMAGNFEKKLRQAFEIRCLGGKSYFLGARMLRNRQ